MTDGETLLVGTYPFTYVVYGRVPVAQDFTALTYLDTITTTLKY